MQYTISVSESGQYIVITVQGRLTIQLATEYTLEAHRRAAELGLTRFLVDARNAVNVESTVTNYEYAYHDLTKQQLNPNAGVALLVAPADHSHDFIETVSRNAGFNVRLFRDEAQAVRWVLSSEV